MNNKKLPGERYRYLPIPVVIDSCPDHPHRTSAIVMDNFNKRRSLLRDPMLSPKWRMELKKIPY